MLRLCAAAGRRLDLLQLPRSGFGQLALVPLGYLLLLLAALLLVSSAPEALASPELGVAVALQLPFYPRRQKIEPLGPVVFLPRPLERGPDQLYPWHYNRTRRFRRVAPDDEPWTIGDELDYRSRSADPIIFWLLGFMLGGTFAAYYWLKFQSHPLDAHSWEIRR